MSKKWLKLSALLVGGATLFGNGCLQGFWQGLWNTGWPTDNRYVNLIIDILNEELLP
jgi:hypothetical protein